MGKPKILYLINGFDRGGAELGLVRLVEGGVFEGCDLTVAGLYGGSAEVRERLSAAGAEPVVLLKTSRLRIHHLLSAFLAIIRIGLRIKPDILILSLPQANILGRLASMIIRPRTVISFEHNVSLAKPVYEWGYWLTSPLVTWMFVDAAATGDAVGQALYRKRPARITVVPLVSFAPSPEPEREPSDDRFVVVSAARFTRVKNQQALIQAAALLRDRGRPIDLVLYGEGPEHDYYAALARRLGVDDRVRMPGFVNAWWRDPADAFVLASRHEGLCIALLEAMHAGVPVATPLVGGVRDYASHDNAFILDDTDPESIARAIDTIRTEREQTRVRAETARRTIDAMYSDAAVARTYAEVNAALRLSEARSR